jgi:hypothetical protein
MKTLFYVVKRALPPPATETVGVESEPPTTSYSVLVVRRFESLAEADALARDIALLHSATQYVPPRMTVACGAAWP